MTDDDRMDRARRIREMREGNRPDAQADDSADAADGAATGPDADAESTDAESTDPDPAGTPEGTAESASVSGDTAAVTDPADQSRDGDGGATMHIPGADVGDVEVDVAELAEAAGLDTGAVAAGEADPVEDTVGQGAVPGTDEEVAGIGMTSARAANAGVETTANETRVLEFNLGEERYCLDIEHVEEIVKRDTVTRVPNTPDYVEGVVDLRGQITTILDPKDLLDIDAEGSKELIVVFDPDGFEDQGAIGWVVDDVNQVTPIADDEVNDSPVEQEGINGVVERDGEFVIWTTPELALDEATG